MDIETIATQLKQEVARINHAIAVLLVFGMAKASNSAILTGTSSRSLQGCMIGLLTRSDSWPKPRSLFLPRRLILRMGVIAFASVNFVAVLLGNDLDLPEFSIPVLVLRVIPEAVLVMKFV